MKNVGEESSTDSGALSSPLSFLRSGSFHWGGAGLNARNLWGSFWSLRSTSTLNSNDLGFYNTGLHPQNNSNRGFGFAVHHYKGGSHNLSLLWSSNTNPARILFFSTKKSA